MTFMQLGPGPAQSHNGFIYDLKVSKEIWQTFSFKIADYTFGSCHCDPNACWSLVNFFSLFKRGLYSLDLVTLGGNEAEWSLRQARNTAVLGSSFAPTTTWICFSVAPSSNRWSR